MTGRVVLWLLDHTAHRTQQIADARAQPWNRVSAWCAREYWRRRRSDATL